MRRRLLSQSLADLEAARAQLLQQFLTLGDFRPGTVSATARRCGRPTCHCARPGDPGHPQFRLLRKVKGKTVAESFSTPLAFRKAAEEVAEFHRFQRLSAELTALNEQICRLRPVAPDPTGWTEAEKNGCWGSSRSRAGSPDAPPGSLCRPTQGPWFRLGSGRDGCSRGSPSGPARSCGRRSCTGAATTPPRWRAPVAGRLATTITAPKRCSRSWGRWSGNAPTMSARAAIRVTARRIGNWMWRGSRLLRGYDA